MSEVGAAARYAARARAGYRTQVDRLSLGVRSAVRVVRAPVGWERWADLPRAEAAP